MPEMFHDPTTGKPCTVLLYDYEYTTLLRANEDGTHSMIFGPPIHELQRIEAENASPFEGK